MANINDELWSRLFLDNKDALTEELEELMGNLKAIRDAVSKGDERELRKLLKRAGDIKRRVG